MMKFKVGDKVKVKQSDDLARFKNITFTVIENNNNYRQFQFATNDGNIECCVSNPLKAAMIIFLCMKDAENEG